jgi:hypothetical protein
MLYKNKKIKQAFLLSILLLFAVGIANFAYSDATGASIVNVTNSTKTPANPQYNNGTRGVIHTVNLNSEQQDSKWKAYVGNVTTTFVLDDVNDYSIYQWTITSFTGQVYITRNESVTWSNVRNATESNKTVEDTNLNHNSASADSINRTFITKIHKTFLVGSNTIAANSSFATVTWQNDANHQLNESAPFQEVLLSDGRNLIFTAFVENDKVGYRGDGTTYDFQAIVPDDATASNPNVRYYFYTELS